MAKAIHMMVRVLDLDRSIAFYQKAFGLKVADRYDFDGFSLVLLCHIGNSTSCPTTRRCLSFDRKRLRQ